MEDLKGKRLITIKILIDEEKDAFAIDTLFQGYKNNNPSILEKILVAGILDEVKKQMKLDLEEVKGGEKKL